MVIFKTPLMINALFHNGYTLLLICLCAKNPLNKKGPFYHGYNQNPTYRVFFFYWSYLKS